jgi:hypothetical protein
MIDKKKLDEILSLHKKWLNDEKDGVPANLWNANLGGANLRFADLRGADWGGANLQNAETDMRYISVSCIGSAKSTTTYCFDDDIVWCGCFKGNLAEFKKLVKSVHKNNEQYLNEYLGFIKYLKKLK